ncbi:MAG: Ig-like domain-containing protein, partial [Candidatus Cloacimonetes bacterium]|nr:Ig-like domain-containing protein [Candidatus Cloacimonadota bacterium]
YVANEIEDITFIEDTIFTGLDLNTVFDDVDIPYGDVLTFSSSTHENLDITIENGIVTMTPAQDWFGQHTVTFTATDDSLASISTDALVTVLNVNDAPVIELPASFTGYEDIPLAIDFAPFISDNDNALEELTLSAVSGDNIVVSIEGHTVTFTPAQDWSGTEEIIFTVDDGVDRTSVRLPRYARNDREVNARNDNGRFFANAQNDNGLNARNEGDRLLRSARNDSGLSARNDRQRVSSSASVSITFLPINDAPYVANPIEDITFDEDTIFTGLDLNNVFDDVDIPYGDVLTFSSSEHENLTITIENGIVTMTPALNWFGQHTVTFAATDDSLASVSTDVLVTVLPVNDAPEIVSVLPDSTQMEIFENTIIEFSVVATDVDNEELFYSWFINEIQAESDSSSFVYHFPENGEFEIKIVVSDGELTAEHIWEITVNSTNINDYVVLKTNLDANYPNPFNPTTTISFDLLTPGKVNISIYNIKGQLVKELINDELKNGRHKILWNGQDQFNRSVGSGIYFYKMQTKDYTKVRRMIMIK